jgi:protocatechuate 3,4-dioxygenase beta subunit
VNGLSRRQALAGLGSVSLATVLAACGGDDDDEGPPAQVETTDGNAFDDAATCTQTAELTEGPFYFDVDQIRSDIREDREGAELRLGVRVRGTAACEPLADAVVDVWHCDATGNYSAEGETYLRGAQVTGKDGVAEFTTVYPGWYPGRTVHIHAKVHIDRQTVLTTQFSFDDEFSEKVFEGEPYASHEGRTTFNENDGLYSEELELTLSEKGGGYRGLITVDLRTPGSA